MRHGLLQPLFKNIPLLLRFVPVAGAFCLTLCLFRFFAENAHRMGLLDLQGKILAFDQKEYKISVGTDIYQIRAAELSPETLTDLKRNTRATKFI